MKNKTWELLGNNSRPWLTEGSGSCPYQLTETSGLACPYFSEPLSEATVELKAFKYHQFFTTSLVTQTAILTSSLFLANFNLPRVNHCDVLREVSKNKNTKFFEPEGLHS